MYELRNKERFKIMYSSRENYRKGVVFIISKNIINLIVSYKAVSERHVTLEISGRSMNVLVYHIYALNMNDEDEQVEKLYKSIEIETKHQENLKDLLIVLGEFNAKVGKECFEHTIRRHGLDEIIERGQRLI